MKKILSLVLVVMMVLSLSTAFAATPVAATTLAYKGDLEIMHFSTSEESQGNGGSDGFRTTIAAWEAAHPDIKLTQNILANAEYKTQVATLAAANDLPDVFLLQGMNTISWSSQNLVLDLTEAIKNSPYAADYNTAYFTPFTTDGKIYGLQIGRASCRERV
jgi:raffinose/stachyose/melibiose transport system substrate-binding protein